jgi:hypothetical protein
VTLHEKFCLLSVHFSGRYVLDVFNFMKIGLEKNIAALV